MRKAQNLVEILLVIVIIGVAAFVFLTPHAQKIASMIKTSTPVKNPNATTVSTQVATLPADLSSVFNTNGTVFVDKFNTLTQSSSFEAAAYANEVASAAKALQDIESKTITDNDLAKVVAALGGIGNSNNPRPVGTETSGSIANFISSSLNNTSLEDTIKNAATGLKEMLQDKKVHLEVAGGLTTASNSAISALKEQIEVTIPRSVLLYEGANYEFDFGEGATPVTIDNITKMTKDQFNTFFNANFQIGESTGNPISNFINSFIVVDNVSKKYGNQNLIPEDKLTALRNETKKALSLE